MKCHNNSQMERQAKRVRRSDLSCKDLWRNRSEMKCIIFKEINKMKITETTDETTKTQMICAKCGYKWKTSSVMFWVTCPRCMHKSENKHKED